MILIMQRYLIVILVFIVSTNISYSSDCKTITKFEEYDKSEMIILGYITDKVDEHFNINILEVFKGEDIALGSKVQGFLGDGLINPNIGETWLLYGSFSEKGLIVNICGHSRSFNSPYSIGGYSIPPPPASNETSKEAEDLMNNIYLNRALSELHYDLMNLRHRKLQKEFTEFKNQYGDINSYLMWFVFGFSLLFLAFGLFRIISKKSSAPK